MTVLSSTTKDDLFNLNLIRSYVDKELNPRFVERHWLKKQVEDKLAIPDCRFLLLTAEPGAGKSAFMAWLAHQHPNWCRYFIRRDQRTPLGDVGSYSFLLQVGFQLAATYPDLFKQEQIKIVVEQRIGTATNSEIVGAEIAKMFASPFYEKVIQIQQQVTHSKDTNITGVRVGEFYATERDLPLENLQFMALFDPAKAMMKQMQEAIEHSHQQIVVLVDALDELRYQDSSLSLLKWLTNCPELPASLRFILTCRPDDDLLRAFRGNQQGRIQEIAIAEEDPDVEKDLTCYIRFLIETPEVNQTLIETHQDSDEFIHQAITKANGNFGYLGAIGRAADEAIRQNQQELLRQILKLSELPDTLQDLYAFFLGKIKNAVAEEKVPVEDAEGKIGFVPVWSAVYKPILGILSVALEPLTPTQIQKLGLIHAEFDYVIGAIEKLQQFLDQLGNCYRLYHSTLPEFFTSSKTKERNDYSYCYVDAVKQNQHIVNFYQAGAKSWTEADLKKIVDDDYGRRHLAQHLVKADRVEELHTLLSLEKDGKNAWFDAKNRIGDTAGFLADVKLAWEQADQKHISSEIIELQCRYALMTSSLNKLAENLSVELLVAAVRADEWTFEKAFFYAMQMQPRQRVETLIKLIEVLPERLRLQVIQTVLQTAESIKDEKYLIATLSNLVPHLSTDILPEIWKTLKIIKDEKLLAQALTVLAPKLTPDWLTEALKATISFDYHRVETLEQIAPYLKTANLLFTALEAIKEVQDGRERDKALKVLVPHLYSDLQKPALEIALKTWYSNRGIKYASEALTELASQLPSELLSQALESARNFSAREVFNQASPDLLKYLEAEGGGRYLDEPHRDAYVEVLEVLAPFLTSDLCKAVFKTAIDSLWGEKLAQALVALVPYLPDALEPALKTIYSLRDSSPEKEAVIRADYLVRLACNLPTELTSHQPALLKEALEATLKATPVSIINLFKLLPDLPEALHHALETIQRLDDSDTVFDFLSLFTSYVTSEQLPVALSIINILVHESSRYYLLRDLVPHHPTVLPLALESALKLRDESRSESLKELFSKFSPEHLHRILTTARELSAERLGSNDCADILVALAPHLTETLLPKAVEVALNIQKFEHHDRALVALITCQPTLFPSALLVSESKRGLVTSELQMKRALQDSNFLAMKVSLSIEGRTEQVEALLALIPHFPAALSLALKRLLDSGSEDAFCARALVQLAPHLDAIPHLTTESIDQALEVAKVINKDERLQALKEFVNHLKTELLSQFLDVALAIKEENYYVQVLIALVPRLGTNLDSLSKVLEAALLVKTASHRAALLAVLAPYLPSSVAHALRATSLIGDKYHCAQVLTALSKNLCKIASQALEVALSIDEDFYRARALTSLIPILPENLLDKVHDFVSSLKQYENYDATLTELAFRLPETVSYALDAFLAQWSWPYNLENFTQLVPHLSENLIHKVLLAIEKVDYAPKRVEVLIVLVGYAKVTVPKVMESTLEAASSQSLNDSDCAEALMKIAPHLDVTHLQKALEIVQSIQLELYQAFALRALAPQLIQSPKELIQALKIAETFKHHSDPFGRDLYYAYVMSALKPELTENLITPIPQILESSWFWAFPRGACIQFLNELLPYMTVEQRLALLEAVESLNNQPEQIYSRGCLGHALPILSSNLPQEYLCKALAAVKSVKSISDKIAALTTLAPRLGNKLLDEALEIVQSQFVRAQDCDYVKVINVLAPYLKTPDLLNKALENISSFNYQNNSYQAEALAALVSVKPEVSSKAIELVFSLDKDRAEILKKLSPYLVQVPQSSSLWKTGLHSLSQYPRPDFLQDLAALIPFVSALVEQPVTNSVARAITNVARWWP